MSRTGFVAALVAVLTNAGAALAQNYPSHPITMMVGSRLAARPTRLPAFWRMR